MANAKECGTMCLLELIAQLNSIAGQNYKALDEPVFLSQLSDEKILLVTGVRVEEHGQIIIEGPDQQDYLKEQQGPRPGMRVV